MNRIKIPIANRNQGFDFGYVSESACCISLHDSLSFQTDLFVFSIKIFTGHLLFTFHGLFQISYLLCSVSQSPSQNGFAQRGLLKACCPLPIARSLLIWIELEVLLSVCLLKSLNKSRYLTSIC